MHVENKKNKVSTRVTSLEKEKSWPMQDSNLHLQFDPAWESLPNHQTYSNMGLYKYISAHNSKSKVKQKILYGKIIIFFLLYLLDFELFS